MHWSRELYGALPPSMRTLPQSIRQAPSPASADDPKNPFGEAKWAFYVPPQRLKEADARADAQEREPPK